MTDDALLSLVVQYRLGGDASLAVLQRLHRCANAQREAACAENLDSLAHSGDERDRLMTALAAIEAPLQLIRQALGEVREQARHAPGYDQAAARHAEAAALIAVILEEDVQAIEALATAEHGHRDEARATEQGEATLAAYRRAMNAPAGATLVDRLG